MRTNASAKKTVKTSNWPQVDQIIDAELQFVNDKFPGKVLEFPEIDEDEDVSDWIPSYYTDWRPL